MVRKWSLMLLCAAVVSLFAAHLCRSDVSPIPPGEAEAKTALEKSTRHYEWVNIPVPGPETKLSSFIVYPERKDKAPVVIVIMEIFGLTDWLRAVTDSLAADGFIAIAPDLLSGRGPGGGGTQAFAGRDDVVKAVSGLSSAQVVTMLDAVKNYAAGLPAATRKFATVGFCWGGGQSFNYATVQPKLGAAVVFYGVSPPIEALSAISAPVLGLYGEDDARVVSTIKPAEEKMKELGKIFIAHIYKGAGHGFLRAQAERNGANLEASRQAWPAAIQFLRQNLEQ
ncbi:MAG: dienelactone hydrolase family protein [Syntrophobacteraceae bacterium]